MPSGSDYCRKCADLLVEPKRYELEGKKEKSEAGKKDKKPSESKGKEKEGEEDEEDSEIL